MANVSSRKDIVAFEKLPLPDLPESTYQAILNSALTYPERIALQFFLQAKDYKKSYNITYQELLDNINATANMFRGLGLMDTDTVTYILPNLPETIFTVYGGETAGIANAINPLLEPLQMADIMNAAETKILVTLAPFPKTDIWNKVSSILDKIPTLTTILTVSPANYLGFLPKTILGLTTKRARVPNTVKVLDFNKIIKNYSKDKLSFNRKIDPEDIASYFHTGGTTGKPKIAQHTHRNEIFNAWSLVNAFGLDEQKRFFCGLPWFHVNGVIVTGLFPFMDAHTLVLGTPAGYRGKGVLDNFWKIVEHYKISFFSSVPTVLQYLLEVKKTNEDISSLEYAFCGAAPLSNKLFHDFEATTGITILEGYGFTEGTCANSGNPRYGERKIGSIGLATAHHHMKIAILDESKKYIRDANVNEIGIIIARGENIFPGYKEAIHNEDIWVHDGTYKWYNTGDLGRQDEDGYFWITGRKKELIIRGGHNIDPKSIEDPLSKHPMIATVAAIARPDKRLGEIPVAYVQLKPGISSTEEELLAFAKEHIKERAAVPKSIYILDELPLTAIGKIFKPALSKRQIKETFEKDLATIKEIEDYKVEVSFHEKKGLLATISTTCDLNKEELTNKVNEVLGAYTVPFEII